MTEAVGILCGVVATFLVALLLGVSIKHQMVPRRKYRNCAYCDAYQDGFCHLHPPPYQPVLNATGKVNGCCDGVPKED